MPPWPISRTIGNVACAALRRHGRETIPGGGWGLGGGDIQRAAIRRWRGWPRAERSFLRPRCRAPRAHTQQRVLGLPLQGPAQVSQVCKCSSMVADSPAESLPCAKAARSSGRGCAAVAMSSPRGAVVRDATTTLRGGNPILSREMEKTSLGDRPVRALGRNSTQRHRERRREKQRRRKNGNGEPRTDDHSVLVQRELEVCLRGVSVGTGRGESLITL